MYIKSSSLHGPYPLLPIKRSILAYIDSTYLFKSLKMFKSSILFDSDLGISCQVFAIDVPHVKIYSLNLL